MHVLAIDNILRWRWELSSRWEYSIWKDGEGTGTEILTGPVQGTAVRIFTNILKIDEDADEGVGSKMSVESTLTL